MFYNTGIATYVWVLTNRKSERRRGQVQLIDATQWYSPLRKNLGNKNCELSDSDIARICDAFLGFEESEQSKIFPNAAFGYEKGDRRAAAAAARRSGGGAARRIPRRMQRRGRGRTGRTSSMPPLTASAPGRTDDFGAFVEHLTPLARTAGLKLTARRKKLLQNSPGRAR